MTPTALRTPVFYHLPKIHKEGNPGRPIVSSFNSPTERISAFVDGHLQPFVNQLNSHIKDTFHFLEKLHNLQTPLPANSILVTVDVTALYTNISTTQGLSAVEHFLSKRPPGTKPDTNFIVQLTKMVLSMNNFRFQDKHFLQINGTAMGTRMAPAYANLYMGRLENNFLSSQELLPLCFYRFIDDIFMIWTHGQEKLETFLTNLNKASPLQFTWTHSTSYVTFLDVDINLHEGIITTKVHFKPTNKMLYLHSDSCHPAFMKSALPVSLAARGRRICSDEDSLATYCDKITNALVNRGYNRDKVRRQLSRRTKTTNKSADMAPLTTQWYPGLQALNGIIKAGLPTLQASNKTRDMAYNMPRVQFRRPPNLTDLLVSKDLATREDNHRLPQGSYPCNRPRCKTCPMNPPTSNFKATLTGQTYPIHGHNNCTTSNILYQLKCTQCAAEYIGMTTNDLRTRMTGHRQSVTNQDIEKPVAAHAAMHNLSLKECFTTRVIKALPPTNNQVDLRAWEIATQHVTRSRIPPNLNLR